MEDTDFGGDNFDFGGGDSGSGDTFDGGSSDMFGSDIPEDTNSDFAIEGSGDGIQNIESDDGNEIPEDIESNNDTAISAENDEENNLPEDTGNDIKDDFEIGGHQNMTAEEVEQYQKDGNEAFNDSLPEDYKQSDEMTDADKQDFVEAQDKFEEEIENKDVSNNNVNTDDISEDVNNKNQAENEYLKIGGDSVNPESPYVTDRQTAEDSGYIEKDGNEVVDSEKAKEELALPDDNPAEYAHEMPHISEETHDLYKSDVAPTQDNDTFSEHEGGGEQTIAIRQEGESLAEGNTETPTYEPEHTPGEEGVIDDRKELSDFSDADWESAYVENEMYDSVKEHNENYQDNQLDFYEISNSGEHFQRADGSSALEDYQENSK